MPEPLIITTPTDREIVVTRRFDAPRDLVFLCYTKPDLLRRWYGLPDWIMTVCEIDLRVGGKWRFATRAPNGFEMASSGVYREIAAPERIVNTETYDQDWTGGETLCTLVLTEADGKTTSTLTVLYASKEARDGAAASPMAEGMEIGFKRLDDLLASNPT
ncbi:SRPBCC family protein [Devosia sp.]|uniref:SRPBCC family protein n=1 Tax=Devosia sp. TaxID=1871048 RepID=UPI003265F0FD